MSFVSFASVFSLVLVSSLMIHRAETGRRYFWPVGQCSALGKPLSKHLVDRDHTLWSLVYLLHVCVPLQQDRGFCAVATMVMNPYLSYLLLFYLEFLPG